MYSRLISYPGGPNWGPSGVKPIVLIALKPYLMLTVNIAPSIERISGTLTMVTKAPTRSARPPNISSKVTSQAFARGHGTPTCLRSSAKTAGPRLHLAHPWTMNPTPRIIRIGIGAQPRHWSSFATSSMGIPFEVWRPANGSALNHRQDPSAGDLLSAVDDHHLPAGLAGLHDTMRFADLLEAKHAGGLGLQSARGHLLGDLLQRHVGQREPLRAKHKAAEEGEVDAAGHL